MKITIANRLAMSMSLLLMIGLLGCSDQSEVTGTQNPKMAAKPIQKDELMTESDLIAESTMDIPESISEKNDENVQEAIEPVDQTIETILSELNEPESSVSESGIETQPLAVESAQQIEELEDLNEVVKPTPELIRKVQQALADAGFNPGVIDGINGPRTMSALKSFQKQNNFAIGQLTKETLQRLGVSY
ncbi:peptidoglycan-binding protein [Nitrosomonas sp. Nm132]|uniref:peptidoglycan-binding domain-containing protein n=1 Tax=Nitrosomonas sp. Nm132 TaxID=1881053 RepID=UPI0008805AAE|nr:peptidoglycan-binding domain-containing protein [Nitrosomonas sp. Nm132]SDH92979.1 Putative peptidoglycan binding domain-containing protein [Nitrosomonas sp. Nm132]